MTCAVCREIIGPWGDGYRHEYGHADHDATPARPRRRALGDYAKGLAIGRAVYRRRKDKQCKGCNARLWLSDPDVCELCDLHREEGDAPSRDSDDH
jgi:hypothetical protein